jgi:DNA polymerase III subunit delta
MPIYFFWGEDELAIAQAAHKLKQEIVDPDWLEFNFDKIPGNLPDATIEALNLAMTPVFAIGERLVWLSETTICHTCSEELFLELQRTLSVIPKTSHLLFTSSKKPDARLKSTKLLQEYGQIQEFSRISPLKTEEIVNKVEEFSQTIGVRLTKAAIRFIAESIGNDTRQLWNELEKLFIYGQTHTNPLDIDAVSTLVNSNTHNSLHLAEAILRGNQSRALQLVRDLINRNEPALRIVATLVGQFRTWTIVKLMDKEKDNSAIASIAEIGNPKRIYYLRKQVNTISVEQLFACLPILLELEFSLKQGVEPLSAMPTKIVELCQIFR